MDMPLVAYGDTGYPLLMFPTAAADYLEYERFLLVDAIKPLIESGLLRAYSINSVNRYSLLNDKATPQWKAELLTRYDRYIMEEVLPLIRDECGQDAKPLTTGASLGAFLAANCYFRHPDQFRGTIAMSGSYDIRSYLKDYYDNNVYFNNPAQYVENLNDNHYLPILQKADSIVIVTGQGAFEAPERSKDFSKILHSKGIPHLLELWGHDVKHDWDWWRKMLPHYLERFFG
jgi:esterase/lipase superfamily enzyme